MSPTTPTIEARNLTKTYPGGIEAVKGIDFAVAPGEVFGLLGPNGAGKSTTVGMFATTVVPTSGTARLAGHDVARDPIAARRSSAVVFQDAVVDKPLSGRYNLMVHARLWGLGAAAARARVDTLVDLFGLAGIVDRPVGGYSGGERRRLEIARALVSEPRVLFLDEPTVGLDTRVRHELIDLIGGLRARSGMTILLTTHYLDEAEHLCDRVAIVHTGRVVALDTPAALLARVGREVVELRVAGNADAALATLRAHDIADGGAFTVGHSIHVPLHERRRSGEVTAAIAGLGLGATAVITRPPTLDDVYLQLTGQVLAPVAA
ncbi:MAG TPA: ABC transporter ATP-binding protein [Acidimicrobiales bacterium]|jgi:ABC-2 type transport system ATP-binding protein|nr:ABC transporter ATP-binding protein [Acidimicrobiales bacterium]